MGWGPQSLPVTASSAIHNVISSHEGKHPLYCAAEHQQNLFLAQQGANLYPALYQLLLHIHPDIKATRAVQQPRKSGASP